MSTVHLPEDLIAKLRTLEGDEQSDVSELVTRVLNKYVVRVDSAELLARARKIGAELAHAGVSEEELEADFEQWRRRGCPDS